MKRISCVRPGFKRLHAIALEGLILLPALRRVWNPFYQFFLPRLFLYPYKSYFRCLALYARSPQYLLPE